MFFPSSHPSTNRQLSEVHAICYVGIYMCSGESTVRNETVPALRKHKICSEEVYN